MWMWLDKNDRSTVLIADKVIKPAVASEPYFVVWASMCIDGVHDLFGGDVKERLTEEPMEVHIAVLKIDGEDVSGCADTTKGRHDGR